MVGAVKTKAEFSQNGIVATIKICNEDGLRRHVLVSAGRNMHHGEVVKMVRTTAAAAADAAESGAEAEASMMLDNYYVF